MRPRTSVCAHMPLRAAVPAPFHIFQRFSIRSGVFRTRWACYRFGQWSVRAQPSYDYACAAVFWEIKLYWKWHRIEPSFTVNRIPCPWIRSARRKRGFSFYTEFNVYIFFVHVDSPLHDFLTSLVSRWERKRERGRCISDKVRLI